MSTGSRHGSWFFRWFALALLIFVQLGLGARLGEDDEEEFGEGGGGQGPSSLLSLAQTTRVHTSGRRANVKASAAVDATQRKAELVRESRRALEEKLAEASKAAAAASDAERQMEALINSDPGGLNDVPLLPTTSASSANSRKSHAAAQEDAPDWAGTQVRSVEESVDRTVQAAGRSTGRPCLLQASVVARSADVVTSEGLEIQDESSDGATATAADQSMEATMTAVSDAERKG